jgi:Flp pilus assembly protein TadB
MIVVAVILRSLPNYRANARTRRSADDRALQAAAEDRTQHRAAGTADQRALPRSNSALPVIVVIVIMTIAVVVVAAASASAPHAVVVRTIVVVLLPRCRHHRSGKKKRNRKDRISYLGHSRLDAGFCSHGQFFLRKLSRQRTIFPIA